MADFPDREELMSAMLPELLLDKGEITLGGPIWGKKKWYYFGFYSPCLKEDIYLLDKISAQDNRNDTGYFRYGLWMCRWILSDTMSRLIIPRLLAQSVLDFLVLSGVMSCVAKISKV